MEDTVNKISIKNELLRKSIHLSSSIVPALYYFVDREFAIYALSAACVILILLDILRAKYDAVGDLYLRFMKPILRGHEIEKNNSFFTGGTYITISFLLCVVLFPKPLAITAMFIVIFCDSMAALIGKSKGKHFIANKTVEGSLAFLVTGIIIIILTPKISDSLSEYYIGIFAVFLSAVFELVPVRIDDNISIPLFFGLIYLLLYNIFL
ncbi:MAG TPA: SEC59/DGK1/VTE5 family protein [Ignavibacteria bacterium]|nr:SEC59/DGK1/VTE5 family protein [Ignavibacteria bacterium]HMR41331.1 SEC59/DGK1/VTE5 family protein [Ignavibacteria bacterium]